MGIQVFPMRLILALVAVYSFAEWTLLPLEFSSYKSSADPDFNCDESSH